MSEPTFSRDEAFWVIDEALDKGVQPETVVFELVIPSIEKMIKGLTSDIDAIISQHFIASQVAEEIAEKKLASLKRLREPWGK